MQDLTATGFSIELVDLTLGCLCLFCYSHLFFFFFLHLFYALSRYMFGSLALFLREYSKVALKWLIRKKDIGICKCGWVWLILTE